MIKNIAIVSLSRGILGEPFMQFEVEIGLRRLKELGLNVRFMPHALKGLEYVECCHRQGVFGLFRYYDQSSDAS